MDFAFGTLSTTELKQYHHQLSKQGLQHKHEIHPRRPQANEPLSLFASVGSDVSANSVQCIYTTDGTEPDLSNGTRVPFQKIATEWDSFIWGYTTRWQVTLPGFPQNTRLNYRIFAQTDNNELIFADYPDLKQSSENAAHRHFSQNLPPDPSMRWGNKEPGTVFTIFIGQTGAPDWAKDAIIYHLMVDRFHPGDPGWKQTTDLGESMGGTLEGVLNKLEYFSDLGINTLWFSPIWETPSYHGYDTRNYYEVEPRFGSKDTLRKLIDSAHDRGIRILFDMACNHISNHHPIFQQALSDSTSAYRNWFTFDDSDLGYRAFFGVESMPEMNFAQPDARDWMIENALYWIKEFDIDGYRLDYAQGAGPDFWSHFMQACKAEKPDVFCFGEIIETPEVLQAYVGRLDGALDFHINHALRQTYGLNNWSRADFQRFLGHHQNFMPNDFIMPAFIDNHDMDRFLLLAGNQEQAYKAALEQLMALPNPPVLLYGTEIGLEQNLSTKKGTLDLCRPAMLWGDNQNQELLEFTKSLIQKRKLNTKAA